MQLALFLIVGVAWPGEDPTALVRQLGAPVFSDREAAEKQLKDLGMKALPAVIVGLADPDAEVQRRCKSLHRAIREEWRATFAKEFAADHDGARPHSHPVWDRFVRIVGDTKESRKLFGELIANDKRFANLDDATADPSRANALYVGAVTETARMRAELMKVTFRITVWPGEEPVELANLLYLGACGTGNAWPKEANSSQTCLPAYVAGKPLRGPARASIEKLFVAWLDRQDDGEVVKSGLDVVFCLGLKEGLPVARRKVKATTPTTRAAALPVLGRFGSAAEDSAACEALIADATSFAAFDSNGYLPRGTAVQKRTVQVKDVAAAVLLSLNGADPRTHGFNGADDPTWREFLVSRFDSFSKSTMRELAPGSTKEVPKELLLWPPAHGFEHESDRAEAHAKFESWRQARRK